MMRSMFAGVSGLRTHQTMMDVVGNNIANVNTTGYKGSTATFADTLSQTVRAGSAPGANGGTNAAQVGLGVRLGGINVRQTQGSLQTTGRTTDLAIAGEGFFAVRSGGATTYTRAGAFSLDGAGRLTSPSGAVLQGWAATADGRVDTASPVADLRVPVNATIAPVASTRVVLGGNLSTTTEPGAAVTLSAEVFDSLGTATPVAVRFTRAATPNTWSVSVTSQGTPPASLGPDRTVTFDPTTGEATGAAPGPYTISDAGTGASATFSLDLGVPGSGASVTQLGATDSIRVTGGDGQAAGTLKSFAVADDGSVQGIFSNGRQQVIGQVAVATFANPGGLTKVGDTMFAASPNSGVARLQAAGVGGAGSLSAGTLEMSNVELAEEFSNLILAQRGFQANSRVISASDEMLADLVNLKR